jgi:hypothetical protein
MLSVKVDLSELMAAGPIAGAGIFANLSAAVQAVVETGEERWKAAALKAPLWDGERRAYADSIQGRMTGPFSGEIVSSYKYVQDIESGRPPYDMKRMLDTSPKVRVSKKGRRYLIIPFRHNTPGQSALAVPMPKAVHAEARNLAASQIVGHGVRRSGLNASDIKTRRPMEVRARRYVWGGRLGAGMAPKLKPQHKSDPYAGMVRFKANNPGGSRSSTYLTFRVMAEGSSGWVIGARPGLWIARAVSESLQRTAAQDFPAAIAADLAGL